MAYDPQSLLNQIIGILDSLNSRVSSVVDYNRYMYNMSILQAQSVINHVQDTILAEFKKQNAGITSVLSNYLGGLTDVIMKMDDRLRYISNTVLEIDETINSKLLPELSQVENRIQDLIFVLNNFEKDFKDRMELQLTEITNQIENAYKINQEFLKSEIDQMMISIDNTKQEITKTIKSSASETNDTIKVMQANLSQTIQQGTSQVITNANANTQTLTTHIDSVLGSVSSAVDKLDSDLTNTMWAIYNDWKQFCIDAILSIHGKYVYGEAKGETLLSHFASFQPIITTKEEVMI